MNDIETVRQAVRTSAFDEALSALLGLNATDLRCLEHVMAEPGVTPGRLADLSGLTTGAVTGVLDRLEKAGYVERRPDPSDRRSVAVHPVPARTTRVSEVVAPLDAAIERGRFANRSEALRAGLQRVLRETPANAGAGAPRR